MNPNEALQPVAKKIRQGSAEHAESIPLNQPFPEDLPPAPEVAASADFKERTETEQEKKDAPPEILAPVEEKDDKPPLIAGYKPEDLLAAPAKPPIPVKTESRHATMNSSVVFLIALGTVLAVLGVVLIISFSPVFGIIVALLGAAAVIISVFTPFRK